MNESFYGTVTLMEVLPKPGVGWVNHFTGTLTLRASSELGIRAASGEQRWFIQAELDDGSVVFIPGCKVGLITKHEKGVDVFEHSTWIEKEEW